MKNEVHIAVIIKGNKMVDWLIFNMSTRLGLFYA